MKKIVTAGTISSWRECWYAVDAIRHLGDPQKFNFYIKEFERRFAEYIGVKYAIATTNGTAALHLGLLALGIGKGDEVILPDMTYIACANVIAYTGAKPILVDVDPITWCIDPKQVARAITKRTKAIMPVWMYGNAPDMRKILSVAGRIPTIEDSCPAVGSYSMGAHAGTLGKIGCFSFQGAKVLAIGEGGMMVTNDKKLYEEARLLADMYTTKEFWQPKTGYMYEMNNVSAAVGLGQLGHIEKLLEKKRMIFRWYDEEIGGLFRMNESPNGDTINYWMSSIVTPTLNYQNSLRFHLKSDNIDTRPFFRPISTMGVYPSKYKNTESKFLGEGGINLPSAVHLSKKDIKYVCKKIKEFADYH